MNKSITIDVPRHEVKVGAKEVHLTRKEFELLLTLQSVNGNVLSREDLRRTVWGPKKAPDSRTVDQVVSRLRRKVGTQAIRTVAGYGYQFRQTR